MKRLSVAVALLGALAAFGGAAFFRHQSSASASRATENSPSVASSASRTDVGKIPVIVELFTSEGCSSCPPADSVLSQLVKEQPVPGAEIIALGEHVDYWNYIGWPDPFSSAEMSQRQRAYAQSFDDGQVYTPQAVIDGSRECIGSNRTQVTERIRQAMESPKARVEIRPKAMTGTGSFTVEVAVSEAPAENAAKSYDILLAVIENDLTTEVRRGENAGRRLEHAAVVRKLTTIGQIGRGTSQVFTAATNLAPEWKRKNLRLVAFVQSRETHRIYGAASFAL